MNTVETTLQLWIKKLLDNSVLSVNSTVPAYEVAKLMENSDTGAIVVLENQIPVGIVTNKDLTIKIIAHSYPADTPIKRIMSSPLIFINPENLLWCLAFTFYTLKNLENIIWEPVQK